MPNNQKVERQFFSGNTLEQAVLAAARHYDLEPDQVAYSLRDKKHGFLNIRRRVVIEVDPESPCRPAGEPQQEVAPQRAEDRGSISDGEGSGVVLDELPGEARRADHGIQEDRGQQNRAKWRGQAVSWVADDDSDPEVSALEKAIEELSDLVGTELTPSIRRDDEGFEVELSGPESGLLRERRGSGLVAAEHLLPRLVRGLSGQGVLCRVDSEGFRQGHEEKLRELAQSVAEDVRLEGEERRLEPMNPADRRLVHIALADDPTVRTESEGQGFLKRVRIMPC